MSTIEKRTFSIATEHGNFIDSMVEAGVYATASEVVRAGIRALQEREARITRLLHEGVGPVYDSMQADPSSGLAGATVFSELRDRPKQS